jgi:hypothetical protein
MPQGISRPPKQNPHDPSRKSINWGARQGEIINGYRSIDQVQKMFPAVKVMQHAENQYFVSRLVALKFVVWLTLPSEP